MKHMEEPAELGEEMPFGSTVKRVDGKLYRIGILVDWQGKAAGEELDEMVGVVKRDPAGGGAILKTDGTIMALDATGAQVFLTLKNGRPDK